ncbi:MAG TPA: polyphosphate polymerase domain-containing protein [Vicinamibacteria bacterium]|nr:polyphosphate polymerase domain-containing protein [Vicinamibacteria bacterium]
MARPLRNELKFLVTYQAREALLARWSRHLSKDPHTNGHGTMPILSQYYDSPNLRFYEEKLDGVAFRNKVRVRTYGTHFGNGSATFLEIKQRIGDRVRKIRQEMRDFRYRDLDPDNWRFDDPAAEDAFRFLHFRYRLRRSAQVWYLREAYLGTVESQVRVTFDHSLTALYPGELLSRDLISAPSRRCLGDTLFVLEVKTTNGIPHWVTEGAVATELRQVPVPKYVLAVEKLQLTETAPSGVYP